MQTTTFRTEPFTCPSCVTTIEKVVGRQDGVERARVQFASSKVTVTHDPDRTSAEAIARTIAGLGYPVTSFR